MLERKNYIFFVQMKDNLVEYGFTQDLEERRKKLGKTDWEVLSTITMYLNHPQACFLHSILTLRMMRYGELVKSSEIKVSDEFIEKNKKFLKDRFNMLMHNAVTSYKRVTTYDIDRNHIEDLKIKYEED